MTISAPGKAFLIGEYAVLWGAPAVVTSVNARAIAYQSKHKPSLEEISPMVRAAIEEVKKYEQNQPERALSSLIPTVETSYFTFAGRKLGLGSSAAVVTAVVAYLLADAKQDCEDPRFRQVIFQLARAAHKTAQSGYGSGADIATSVYGGTIQYMDGQIRQVLLPGWLHIGLIDAGAPASTSSLVRAIQNTESEHTSALQQAIEVLRSASQLFLDATSPQSDENPNKLSQTSQFLQICAAANLHNQGLQQLQELSQAEILTPRIRQIITQAESFGLAAKPSGAGGGDLVVVFSPQKTSFDAFVHHLQQKHDGISLAHLEVSVEGIRREPYSPLCSRLPGFYRCTIEERRKILAQATGVPVHKANEHWQGHQLSIEDAKHMSENVIDIFSLPLSVATNFRINGRDYLIPMCIEEASVVAAASNAAKIIRDGGGFSAYSDPPWMIGQIQLLVPTPHTSEQPSPPDATTVAQIISAARNELLQIADEAHPRLTQRGGGAREISVRILDESMVVVHIFVDCQDAMGANLVNTVVETLAPHLAKMTHWRIGLRILSNLADARRSHAFARIPPSALAFQSWSGEEVIDLIILASKFAELDPYRATTHNKGIMNGMDAVALATGNDWRALEAGAHAYAAAQGKYSPLAVWRRGEDGWLEGSIALPTAVGMVGGATRTHPSARRALQILQCRSSMELGQILACVGLASNLAALRALATEGIQPGHMSLHARSIAVSVGAHEDEIEELTLRLIEAGEIKAARATDLLQEIRKTKQTSTTSW